MADSGILPLKTSEVSKTSEVWVGAKGLEPMAFFV